VFGTDLEQWLRACSDSPWRRAHEQGAGLVVSAPGCIFWEASSGSSGGSPSHGPCCFAGPMYIQVPVAVAMCTAASLATINATRSKIPPRPSPRGRAVEPRQHLASPSSKFFCTLCAQAHASRLPAFHGCASHNSARMTFPSLVPSCCLTRSCASHCSARLD